MNKAMIADTSAQDTALAPDAGRRRVRIAWIAAGSAVALAAIAMLLSG